VLPIVRQKSFLGNFATSVAFFNSGGPISDDENVARALMERARSLSLEAGCSYLELRDVEVRECDWPVRTDKVSMVLPLPATFAALSQKLGSKLRSQAKRAEREDSRVRIGGAELVEDFYRVFASNMRDLGTPVYPRSFFSSIVARFPELCRIVVVDCRGAPAAAGFIVMYNGRAEIPWAACRADAKPLGFNMKLYWEVLTYVVEQRCESFDFGRSTKDAGTYKFKKQWGAEPRQLYWYRWERGAANQGDGSAKPERKGLLDSASAIWQRLPLVVANSLGPLISPKLPW
jgi:serine/alanine adding enzyme